MHNNPPPGYVPTLTNHKRQKSDEALNRDESGAKFFECVVLLRIYTYKTSNLIVGPNHRP